MRGSRIVSEETVYEVVTVEGDEVLRKHDVKAGKQPRFTPVTG